MGKRRRSLLVTAVGSIDTAANTVGMLELNVDPGHPDMVQYLDTLETNLRQMARHLEQRAEEESGASPEPLGVNALLLMLQDEARNTTYWVPKYGQRPRCRGKLLTLDISRQRALFRCLEIDLDLAGLGKQGDDGVFELPFNKLRDCAVEGGNQPWLRE